MSRAEDTALRYLSSRSRTAFEMKKHLHQKGFSDEEIEEVLEEFLSFGYLDDARYCCEYFRYAFGKGKSRRMVFYELKEKGISADLAEIAFEDFLQEEQWEFDEKKTAREEAQKVLRAAGIDEGQPVEEKILARIGRKLQSKGYSGDIIYIILGELRT